MQSWQKVIPMSVCGEPATSKRNGLRKKPCLYVLSLSRIKIQLYLKKHDEIQTPKGRVLKMSSDTDINNALSWRDELALSMGDGAYITSNPWFLMISRIRGLHRAATETGATAVRGRVSVSLRPKTADYLYALDGKRCKRTEVEMVLLKDARAQVEAEEVDTTRFSAADLLANLDAADVELEAATVVFEGPGRFWSIASCPERVRYYKACTAQEDARAAFGECVVKADAGVVAASAHFRAMEAAVRAASSSKWSVAKADLDHAKDLLQVAFRQAIPNARKSIEESAAACSIEEVPFASTEEKARTALNDEAASSYDAEAVD